MLQVMINLFLFYFFYKILIRSTLEGVMVALRKPEVEELILVTQL